MKRFVFSLIVAVALMGVSSCVYTYHPSKDTTRLETRDKMNTYPLEGIERITSIDVRQGIEVKFAQSGERKITVSTNLQDDLLLEINVDGEGKMNIGYKDKVMMVDKTVKTIVTISGYDVRDFEATSGANIDIEGRYTLRGELDLDASSGGTINLSSGQVDYIEAVASSSADIILGQVTVNKIEMDASSGADIRVQNLVAESVSAIASSGADILLAGKTKRVDFNASSGADIKANALSAVEGSVEATSGADVKCRVRKLTQTSDSGGDIVNCSE